ncbi:hypothetical protein VTN02DRAFT_3161 [Thermoascus thermophilus]
MHSSDLRKKVGQLFAVGFHGLTPSPEIKTLIRDYGLGAIILFKRNVQDAVQLQSLTAALQQEAKDAGHEHPLLIGIDQENGLVTRIPPPVAAQMPGPMALGATGSTDFAYEVGKATGKTLDFFGINMNYAPVCDVNSEPLNPVIGVRSPGDDPELVGRVASATAKGLREGHVVPTVKHFPGHGDTAVDSHFGLPVITKSRDELERCELVPFRRAVAEGIEAVMTAHISLPGIDDSKLPATLSPNALNILRRDMKYDGLIITDCLEMDGIRATYGTVQGSVLALKAGSDSIMICHTYEVQVASIDAVCQAVETGDISPSRLDEALRRVTQLKSRFLTWDTALGRRAGEDLRSLNFDNAKLAKEVYSQSTTLVRSKPGVLPLSKFPNIVFLSPGEKTPTGGGAVESGETAQFIDILRTHTNNTTTDLRYGSLGLSPDDWKIVDNAEAVILVTRNAGESSYQRNLVLELAQRKEKLIVIATANPYDFLEDPVVETYITIYEPTLEAFSAAADVIFGAAPAKGTLPVGPGKVREATAATVMPFNVQNDLDQVAKIWNAALPGYPLPAENLRILLDQANGHHFVARTDSTIVGFCAAYTTVNQGETTGQIAALVVDPTKQGQGIGTALLRETRSYFRTHFGLVNLALGSIFPRFWPGIPADLPPSVPEFFIHRGFRVRPPVDADLYQDIRDFRAPQKYLDRAAEGGYTFAPLRPEQYEECIVAQKRNFSSYAVSTLPFFVPSRPAALSIPR